ncbi:MAG TPA: DUF6789 family protein [Candidatus Acidoferrum sp.]|nr:DUF6789 family protein [Candidatus Acidoferrum sp.]
MKASFRPIRGMTIQGWIWKPFVAGLCGTVVHFLFMYFKTRTGLLPSFQPYQSFQTALSHAVGTNVPAIVPWLLSFVNGMAILGFLFARVYKSLPGQSGATKGLIFGLIGWVLMNLIFFPLIGLGPFAIRAEASFGPALLSLAMLLTYSMVLGTVYVALNPWTR